MELFTSPDVSYQYKSNREDVEFDQVNTRFIVDTKRKIGMEWRTRMMEEIWKPTLNDMQEIKGWISES